MMKYKLIQLLRCLTICAAVGFSTSVSAQDIRWGGVVNPGGGSERENILHAPDHRYTAIDPPLTVSFFVSAFRNVFNTRAGVNPSTMHYTGLARLLGIPEAMLARADVIAFEGNGGAGAGIDGDGRAVIGHSPTALIREGLGSMKRWERRPVLEAIPRLSPPVASRVLHTRRSSECVHPIWIVPRFLTFFSICILQDR
jgi:hypothetical protein